ncbi:MAG: UPF0182 family protein [Acidobacteria bacterium]|nr:UPF0182 family protein [Acidobacteriota bacterium]
MNNAPYDDEFDDDRPKRNRSKRSRWLLFLPLLLLVLFLWPGWAGFYSEYLWFQELGYQRVFTRTLLTKFGLGAIVTVLSALLLWLNIKLALKLSSAYTTMVRYITINKERVPLPDIGRFIERWIFLIALLIGLFFGLSVWESWEVILQYNYQAAFGDTDPLFGRDISFYFFTLPFLEFVAQLLFLFVIVCLISAAAVYVLRGGIVFGNNAPMLRSGPRKHLLGLVTAFFFVMAGRTWLELPNLLYSTSGTVNGAGYTDVAARMPMLRVEVVAAILVAVMAIATMFRPGIRLILLGLGIYLLAIVIGGWIYPTFVQRFSVAPNELEKETPYIANNIKATRKGFGLDKVEERELAGDVSLTLKDIQDNKTTINNVRLWDRAPLLETFGQLQEIRTYYQFESVDNDRYRIGGELRQTMISPRELASDTLPNRNWINERLTFTHGFGLTLGPVNQITPEGLPVLFIKDLPPVSTLPELKVTRPEIYFGEISHDPVYVKTNAKEFNYPSGDKDVYSNYEGTGGVSIGSYWRKLLFATRFGDMKMLLSDAITADSRVLYYRDIKDRLSRIAPFLQFDQDPYMVVSEGRLFWIADAYTVSNRYPYSEQFGGINYIRNSVKAVVDAYNGDVRLYLADDTDPLIQTWARIFPGMFKPLTELSADLRAHLAYPKDIFTLQTQVYSTYHMNQPQVFYNKEDQWEVAAVNDGQKEAHPMEPYHNIMKLPGEEKEEYIIMLPFTPRNKDNLASWIVARSDGENYGKLRVYRFPKQKLIYGPKQVMARINQDAEISRQLSLWDQRGSRVDHGTLLVIPIKESLLYIQPLYLRAESGNIPELKRVIVVAENKIAMEETLEASLARIFGTESPATQPTGENPVTGTPQSGALTGPAADLQGLAAQAKQHYDRATQAQREGDWARYGEEIKKLGAVLDQMKRQK